MTDPAWADEACVEAVADAILNAWGQSAKRTRDAAARNGPRLFMFLFGLALLYGAIHGLVGAW